MELNISIELGGAEYPVGVISGEGVADARFTYDKDYISQPDSIPVSASLPFQDAAREVGLGQRIAMQHFDALADRFEAALQQTAAELTEQGYHQAAAIAQEIMSTGGIRHL